MVGVVHHILLLLPGGQVATQTSAVAHVDAQGLELAAHDVRAVVRGGPDHAQGGGVGVDHEFRAGLAGQLANGLAVLLKEAQEGGVGQEHAGGVPGQLGLQVGQVQLPVRPAVHGDEAHPLAGALQLGSQAGSVLLSPG